MCSHIDISDIVLAEQIISYINGTGMFYVENPYITPAGLNKISQKLFLTFKDITNGTALNVPKIYAKINNNFTSEFKIKMFTKNVTCKLFGQFAQGNGNVVPKSNNKFMIGFGKWDKEQATKDHKFNLILHQQLCYALDFLMIAKLLSINIDSKDTDDTFIDKVAAKLGLKSNDKKISTMKKELKAKYHYCKISKSGKNSKSDLGFFDKFKLQIKEYTESHSVDLADNEIYKFYDKDSDEIYKCKSPMPAFSINQSVGLDKETKQEKIFENITGKLNFVLKLEGGKNDFYATKIVKKNVLCTLTYLEYMSFVESKMRKDCNFVISLSYDIRKFASGPVIGTKIDVSQCVVRNSKLIEDQLLLNDEDSDEEEIKTSSDIAFDANTLE